MAHTLTKEQLSYCDGRTWNNIEIGFHGPYTIPNLNMRRKKETSDVNSYLIITIQDTFSKWISAKCIQLANSSGQAGNQGDVNLIANDAACFIFTTLCYFGLAKFSVNYNHLNHNHRAQIKQNVKVYLEEKLDSLGGSIFEIPNQKDEETSKTNKNPTRAAYSLYNILDASGSFETSSQCNEISNITIKKVINDYTAKLSKESANHLRSDFKTFLDIYMFNLRINFCSARLENEENEGHNLTKTPFSHMFAHRDPFLGFKETNYKTKSNDEEAAISSFNASRQYQRRRNLKSSILECRHCGDTFHSRISFKVHQKYHLEEAKRRGYLEGQKFAPTEYPENEMNINPLPMPDEDGIESNINSQDDYIQDPDYKIGSKNDHDTTLLENSRSVKQGDGDDLVYKVPASGETTVKDNMSTSLIMHTRDAKDSISIAQLNGKKKSKATTEDQHRHEMSQSNERLAIGRYRDKVTDYSTKETAVQNVKALIAATKGDRRKRGKYTKYNQELRDEITAFSVEHGASKTAKTFTKKLGFYVSESTVRNFIKSSVKKDRHGLELKDEIGHYAHEFGIPNCIEKYKQVFLEYGNKKLKEECTSNPELTMETVSRLKTEFLSKIRENNDLLRRYNVDNASETENSCLEVSSKAEACSPKDHDHGFKMTNLDTNLTQRFVFEDHLKLDIGKYALHYGNVAAIDYFSSKLQINMKESTVRKFKRLWMKQRKTSAAFSRSENWIKTKNVNKTFKEKLASPDHSTPIPVTNSSLNTKPGEIFLRRSDNNSLRYEGKQMVDFHKKFHSTDCAKTAMNEPLTSSFPTYSKPHLIGLPQCIHENTTVQHSMCDDPEYNNSPVSLTMKDKGTLMNLYFPFIIYRAKDRFVTRIFK